MEKVYKILMSKIYLNLTDKFSATFYFSVKENAIFSHLNSSFETSVKKSLI